MPAEQQKSRDHAYHLLIDSGSYKVCSPSCTPGFPRLLKMIIRLKSRRMRQWSQGTPQSLVEVYALHKRNETSTWSIIITSVALTDGDMERYHDHADKLDRSLVTPSRLWTMNVEPRLTDAFFEYGGMERCCVALRRTGPAKPAAEYKHDLTLRHAISLERERYEA